MVKRLKRRRSHHGIERIWWFAATAVLVLAAVFLFTVLVAAVELRWGVIPNQIWIME
jgi:hypothetical protein